MEAADLEEKGVVGDDHGGHLVFFFTMKECFPKLVSANVKLAPTPLCTTNSFHGFHSEFVVLLPLGGGGPYPLSSPTPPYPPLCVQYANV